MKKDNLSIFLYICMISLLISILPLPYAFYIFNKLLVTAGAGLIIYKEFNKNTQSKWIIAFGIIALLFNPVVKVPLEAFAWRVIDIAVLGVFLSFLLKENAVNNFKNKIIAVIVIILLVGLPIIVGTQNHYDYKTAKKTRWRYNSPPPIFGF